MTVLEKTPGLDLRTQHEDELRIERTDISFNDLPGDMVRIEITVRNDGIYRSAPTPMTIESAPLGAFVPWWPLARLMVPPLEPGESRVMTTNGARPRPMPLGDFNRVPPKKLLTAVSAPSDTPPPQTGGPVMTMLNFLRTRQTGRPPRRDLAPDLWDLLGREQPHWAGNINVFVGARPVERHLAKALRVYPGRTNLAMFMVGDPRGGDGYAFELESLSSDWKAVLYDVSNNESLPVNPQNTPIRETQWVEANGMMMVMLAIQPPAACEKGCLEVQVTRRSCGKTAVVEFDLDPKAQGAGCYYA